MDKTASKDSYPQRPKHFAHKFTRLLFRAAVVNDLGDKATLLLIHVVHTEDAKFYSGPVTFWTDQSADMLGLRRSAFFETRRRVVEAGWLHYEPGSRYRPARYWVTIPPSYSSLWETELSTKPDTSSNQPSSKPDGSPDAKPVNRPADWTLDRTVDRTVDRTLSTLTLNPNPSSCSEPEAVPELSAFVFPVRGTKSHEWALPASKIGEYKEAYPDLDIDAEMRAARQWCRDNPTKRKTPRGMPRFLASWLERAQNSPRRKSYHGNGEDEPSIYPTLTPDRGPAK